MHLTAVKICTQKYASTCAYRRVVKNLTVTASHIAYAGRGVASTPTIQMLTRVFLDNKEVRICEL